MWCLVCGFWTFILYQLFSFFFCSDLKAFRGHDGDKIIFLTWLDTNLPQIQGARPDHVRVESSSCYFPRELVGFVLPRELDCFDPCHVTRSCPIKKAVWVGRYNNMLCCGNVWKIVLQVWGDYPFVICSSQLPVATKVWSPYNCPPPPIIEMSVQQLKQSNITNNIMATDPCFRQQLLSNLVFGAKCFGHKKAEKVFLFKQICTWEK